MISRNPIAWKKKSYENYLYHTNESNTIKCNEVYYVKLKSVLYSNQ